MPMIATMGNATAQEQSAAKPDATPAVLTLSDFDSHLENIRLAVWNLYAGSNVAGKDIRGRTISDDLRQFILTPESVRRLDELRGRISRGGGAPADTDALAAQTAAVALLEKERESLTFIGSYWQGTVKIRHHEELWRRLADQLPEASSRDGAIRLGGLVDAWSALMTPPFDQASLAAAAAAMVKAYNEERQKLAKALDAQHQQAGIRPAGRNRQRSCTAPAQKTSGTAQPQRIADDITKDIYPASARREGVEGTVILRIQINAEGCVTHEEIAQSSGAPELDAAALDAIELVRFLPAQGFGHAIATTNLLPWNFNLK